MSDGEQSWRRDTYRVDGSNHMKGISNVRNHRFSSLNFDVSRSHSHLATQQKLGIRTKWWIRFGSFNTTHPDSYWQNLNTSTKEKNEN
jgi:hypothetical protein